MKSREFSSAVHSDSSPSSDRTPTAAPLQPTGRCLLHAIKEPLQGESQWLAAMSGVVRGPAGNNDCRIYVGNLPPDIRTKDVEDVFYKYGTIRDIDLKNRRGGPPFAFIEFEDPR